MGLLCYAMAVTAVDALLKNWFIVLVLAVAGLMTWWLRRLGLRGLRLAAPPAAVLAALGLLLFQMQPANRPEPPSCGRPIADNHRLEARSPVDARKAVFGLVGQTAIMQLWAPTERCEGGELLFERKTSPALPLPADQRGKTRLLWSTDGRRLLALRPGESGGGDYPLPTGEFVQGYFDVESGSWAAFSFEDAARFDFGEPVTRGTDRFADARRRAHEAGQARLIAAAETHRRQQDEEARRKGVPILAVGRAEPGFQARFLGRGGACHDYRFELADSEALRALFPPGFHIAVHAFEGDRLVGTVRRYGNGPLEILLRDPAYRGDRESATFHIVDSNGRHASNTMEIPAKAGCGK